MEQVQRKLASIRKVAEIKPIDGADNIELAIVDGWQCIVKKGDFQPDDFCVYFEIDSFLPLRDEFEFLRKYSYKEMAGRGGFRLKTLRLRGQISQGLLMRVGDFKEIKRIAVEGLDVTDDLKVIKYEPPQKPVKGSTITNLPQANFPEFVRKTDLERVQNIWRRIQGCEETFEVSIKLDGTSCTFYWKDGKFGVCSRNWEIRDDNSLWSKTRSILSLAFNILKASVTLKFSRIPAIRSRFKINGPNNVYWEMANKYGIRDILKAYGENVAIQGEIVGENIQCNPEKIKGHEFYLFDVFDIDKQRYYSPVERDRFHAASFYCRDNPSIHHMPILDGIDDKKITDFKTINDILEYAEGPSVKGEMREGLAFKSYTSNLRFKVVSNQYLLKSEQ